MNTTDELIWVKQQNWFYEFRLPDGTKTDCYLTDEVRKIHMTREKALRQYLAEVPSDWQTAIDVSCHEGFFTHVLSDRFHSVVGIDKNSNSLEKAARMRA
jgi:tRNA (mo5U34)-methyltransferase